jgi:WD40 repeat protein
VGLVAFSPDDRRILITTGPPFEADGGLSYAQVLDATTGAPVLPPLRHQDIVHHAAFSPDGSRIVTARLDHTAQLWDAITGQPFGPPLRHKAGVYYASFSPDGRQVVTASGDRSARVWDVATGRPVLEPLLHTEAVYYASLSPDGSRNDTAGEDQSAFIWDAATGRPLGSPFKACGTVWGATFSPDSRQLSAVAGMWMKTTGLKIHSTLTVKKQTTDSGSCRLLLRLVRRRVENWIRFGFGPSSGSWCLQ